MDATTVEGAEAGAGVATHTIPSGMGGVFPVRVLSREGGKAVVRIHRPGSEWHGWCGDLVASEADLKEIVAAP